MADLNSLVALNGSAIRDAVDYIDTAGGPLAAITKMYNSIDKISPTPGIHLGETFKDINFRGISITPDMAQKGAETLLKRHGLDVGIVKDGVIDSKEMAKIVAAKGFTLLSKNTSIPQSDITPEKYPDAFKVAKEFATKHGLDVKAHPELLQGLASMEVAGNSLLQTYKSTLPNDLTNPDALGLKSAPEQRPTPLP